MQTFLPYPDFKKCAEVIDNKRLWKQVLEANDILKLYTHNEKSNWRNHPCVKMWANYSEVLEFYRNTILQEWLNRRILRAPKVIKDDTMTLSYIYGVMNPPWLPNEALHSSHRAALLKKNFEHYKQFNWKEKPEINYYWPK